MDRKVLTEKISAGLVREVSLLVEERFTARSVGSGSLAVFSTPSMTALMEKAASDLAEDCLPEGWTSVGTALSVEHKAATPLGMSVVARAKVVEVEGRRLVFEVSARDEGGEIGCGRHERFVVEAESFLRKAEDRGLLKGTESGAVLSIVN